MPKGDGKRVRLVTDYTKLNKFVIRPVHPFPSVSDILQSIPANSRCFAKLDATHGYFQIPLSKSASELTTFLLPSGRYRYLRAPMGLSSSSDEWCRHSDRVVEVSLVLKAKGEGYPPLSSGAVGTWLFRERLSALARSR